MTSPAKSANFAMVPHTMNRIDVSIGVDFDEFRAAFEKAAPRYDPEPLREIAERGGSWDEVLAAAAINAPNDLMVYATIDAVAGVALAGHTTKAVEYLLGNHTIAETMFRHDPRALLYAPLRVLVLLRRRRQCGLLDGPAQRDVRQPGHLGRDQGGPGSRPQSGEPVAGHRG
jgi:hypothetical protein